MPPPLPIVLLSVRSTLVQAWKSRARRSVWLTCALAVLTLGALATLLALMTSGDPRGGESAHATQWSSPQASVSEAAALPVRLASGTGTATTAPPLSGTGWLEVALLGLLLLSLLACVLVATRLLRARSMRVAALESSLAEAVAAGQVKSRLVACVSHELRTPLNGILGFAELVGLARSLEEAQGHARVIRSSAEHLNQLVNTLLDLSRIDAGKMELHPERVLLRELMECVIALHTVAAQRKNLDLQLVMAAGTPDGLVTDRTRLTQVLHNLLHNAVKFTDHGRVSCEVQHDGSCWHFTVRDTGIGMDAAQLAQVFERFSNLPLDQAHHAVRGAGLGMALSRELVTLLGGDLRVESHKGSGTVFHLSLGELALPDPPAA